MLIPKRTKYRKQFRGRMKGKEHRGNTVTYGEFGTVATEPSGSQAARLKQHVLP